MSSSICPVHLDPTDKLHLPTFFPYFHFSQESYRRIWLDYCLGLSSLALSRLNHIHRHLLSPVSLRKDRFSTHHLRNTLCLLQHLHMPRESIQMPPTPKSTLGSSLFLRLVLQISLVGTAGINAIMDRLTFSTHCRYKLIAVLLPRFIVLMGFRNCETFLALPAAYV